MHRYYSRRSSRLDLFEYDLKCVSRQIDPRFRTGCSFSIALRASPALASTLGGTDRSNSRTSHGLPVACYESCQSPKCNRYQGPEVGIEPIRSTPPRACRRPGRFIMLISPRQNSTRAPHTFRLNRLHPYLIPPRSFPSLFTSPCSRYTPRV